MDEQPIKRNRQLLLAVRPPGEQMTDNQLTFEARTVLRAALDLGRQMSGDGFDIRQGMKWLLDDDEQEGVQMGSAIAALVDAAMYFAQAEAER